MTTFEQLAKTVREALDAGLRNVYSIERSIEGKAALDSLLAALQEYENCITWDTTCKNCAKLMDTNYGQYVELEEMRQDRNNEVRWTQEARARAAAAEREVRRLREALAKIANPGTSETFAEGDYWLGVVRRLRAIARAALGSESE